MGVVSRLQVASSGHGTDGNATTTHSLVGIITPKLYDGKYNKYLFIIFTKLFIVNHCLFITLQDLYNCIKISISCQTITLITTKIIVIY